ncbi:MAG TPA: bifunctional diaminohydroxyphosphoribosylaminopyrimidine deaminase/5-amino-6-(5-phosphoribosylamino)uracil reductase RibD [Bordetella sp.]|nr:bifunctional diaminohydroxyphosphoribosylaminopyrimidine deaminase/5-amino-6-(5-phosphoribosylamino)uracil reductase RibD [Bordetella sp.]
MNQDQDLHWMRHALGLARQVLYITAPNPRVGCVIVRDGRILGEGATQPPGGPHAEIRALRDAAARGESVAGATFYVTLEPCSHFGRTPPCVDALVAAAPGRVVVAMGDPNPQVNGAGLARLRAEGIPVTTGVCLQEALALNAGFAARMSRGTPWAWIKMAASLDGRSALHNGMSQWITGPEARADGHAWRARADVVLTGMGTVLKDDPRLTVREIAVPRQPRKAVVDGRLQISESARLFDGEEVWIFTAHDDPVKAERLARRNARVIVLPGPEPGRVDLPAMMRWMARNHVNEVHVEAGAGLSGALLSADCVDEILAYIAPTLLGDAPGMVKLPMLSHLDGARRFDFIDVHQLGGDVRLRGRFADRWQALQTAATPR